MKFITYLLVLSFNLMAFAQEAPLQIEPSQIDPDTVRMTSPHLVYTGEGHGNGKLLITIGGTNSRTSDFGALHQVALDIGYQVVAIDYPNSVISTTCRESADQECFNNFRKEVVEGEPVSAIVEIDIPNSLHYRIVSLLKYLRESDSRWSAFFVGDQVDWSRVVIAGHSQGSGHAAYLAKILPLNRALLIAGPQDNFNPKVASWLSEPSATEPGQYFAVLHRNDFFNCDLQLASMKALTGTTDPVADQKAVVSELPTKDGHMFLLNAQYAETWKQFLR